MMVTTRSKNTRPFNTHITTPEGKMQMLPTTPQTDTTVPMSAILGNLEARALHCTILWEEWNLMSKENRPGEREIGTSYGQSWMVLWDTLVMKNAMSCLSKNKREGVSVD
jgi:hypothetical protein